MQNTSLDSTDVFPIHSRIIVLSATIDGFPKPDEIKAMERDA